MTSSVGISETSGNILLNDRDLNRRRIIQEFLLIWLDINLDSSKGHNAFSRLIADLSDAVSSIYTFMDIDECADFLTDIEHQKVFMIVHDDVEGNIMSLLHQIPQLIAIFILSNDKSKYELTTTKNWRKVKGIFSEITDISKSIKRLLRRYDEDNITFSCITAENVESPNLDQLPPSFMYTQLIKETILDLEYNEQSIKDFVTYFNQHRLYYDIDLKSVTAFAETYDSHTSIWWYTSPSFAYSILNKVLRNLETSAITKIAFFIRDLHRKLEQLHKQQFNAGSTSQTITVYRGQGLPSEDFEKLRKIKGGLLSFNNFLSTSFDRDISYSFALSVSNFAALIPILFHITVDTSKSTTPFACIDRFSYYPDEKEVLFSMHTIFRIGKITNDVEHQRLYKVELTLTDESDHQLSGLTQYMRQELTGVGWHRMGQLMFQVGDFNGAEQLYMELLQNTGNEGDKSDYFNQLGLAKRGQGEYKEAVKYFEKTIEIKVQTLETTDRSLATSYNDVALVYNDMGEYSKALEYYEKSIEIRKITLPKNHPDLATSYNNIALVYNDMGEYSKALKYYEKSIEIRKIALPKNHPDLATSYNNIALVYNNMGEYSKALEYYEKDIEITKIALPKNHPDLATSYNNIALVCNTMGEYSKALEYYEKSIEIRKIALPKNHPDLATSYNNTALVYNTMGEYSKALEYYEKSIEITKITLPKNHPNLATSYSNIGQVYNDMGEYSKALEYYEKSIEIKKIALPKNHPNLAISYLNFTVCYEKMGDYSSALRHLEMAFQIQEKTFRKDNAAFASTFSWFGRVYRSMKNYAKALHYFEKCLAIFERTLFEKHLYSGITYSNIGDIHRLMGDYEKALKWHEKALKIHQERIQCNPLECAKTYTNLGETFREMKNYRTALDYLQRGVKIRQEKLPSRHPDLATSYHNLSKLYLATREYNLAKRNVEKALEIAREKLPKTHPHLVDYRETFDKICSKM